MKYLTEYVNWKFADGSTQIIQSKDFKDYPCPKCGNTQLFVAMSTSQSGVIRIECSNKDCGYWICTCTSKTFDAAFNVWSRK